MSSIVKMFAKVGVTPADVISACRTRLCPTDERLAARRGQPINDLLLEWAVDYGKMIQDWSPDQFAWFNTWADARSKLGVDRVHALPRMARLIELCSPVCQRDPFEVANEEIVEIEGLKRLNEKWAWLLAEPYPLQVILKKWTVRAKPDNVRFQTDLYGFDSWVGYKALPENMQDAWSQMVSVDACQLERGIGLDDSPERGEYWMTQAVDFIIPPSNNEHEEVCDVLTSNNLVDIDDAKNTPRIGAFYPLKENR